MARRSISPKGSIAVFDDSTLSFWERSHRNDRKELHGGRVTVYYRNSAKMKEIPFGGGVIRFYGTARIVTDPAVKQKNLGQHRTGRTRARQRQVRPRHPDRR